MYIYIYIYIFPDMPYMKRVGEPQAQTVSFHTFNIH